jgi:4-oxalocrotonate tautomerase
MEIWPGRSQGSKEKLVKALTPAVVENVGCPERAVTIILVETPKENWAEGGKFFSELSKD